MKRLSPPAFLAVALVVVVGLGLLARTLLRDGPRTVVGAFDIGVEQAMAEAARDGSRLAKEALSMAGMPDSKLVELVVRLVDDSD